MNASSRPNPVFAQALRVMIFCAVPLASFLAFSIQPMLGKRLLPIHGGAAGTWLGAMVYFQIALLLGYTWAAVLVRRPLRTQAFATIFLSVAAVLCFHLPSGQGDLEGGIGSVLWSLMLSCLPAMVLLFSISPLMHGWLHRQGEKIPYHIYAISNAGSLLALIAYPFLIETNLGISEQAFFWHGFLLVTAALVASSGFILFKGYAVPVPSETPSSADENEPVDWGRMALWLGLSALTCIGMLGATHHLSAELGSTPVAWVGPFGVYLLSFTVTFAGRWQPWMTRACIAWLAVSLSGYMIAKGFTAVTVNAGTAWWLVSLTASGSFLGNALLHQLRPARRFERYYLVLAAGGVIGGLCSSLLIPALLARPMEFVLASIALLGIGMAWLMSLRDVGAIAITVVVLASPILGLGLKQIHAEPGEGARVTHYRDLNSHIMVKTDDHSAVLSSETTTHGSQLNADEAARRRPTLYYTESTGVGRVLERTQAIQPAMNVGLIGLGAGTLAAYSRKGDVYDFWDIDPKAMRTARTYFTYLADARGRVTTTLRDGRKGLEKNDTDYDVIVLDAFSGDGIPAHLITREAMKAYMDRLSARDGILLVHASSRYSHLFPVVAATARTLDLAAIDVSTEITEATAASDWDPTPTEYIIVCRSDKMQTVAGWFPAEEDKGRVKHTLTRAPSAPPDQRLIWTDERNASIDVLDLSKFLFQP